MAHVPQAHFLVTGMFCAEFRHGPPHGLIAIIIVFELLKFGQKRIPAAFRDPNGEQDEKAVEAGFFDNNAMFCKVFRHD